MGRMLQIRNIPPELHDELMRRAKASGHTLTGYVQEILEREVSRPPRVEVFARIGQRQPVRLGKRAAEIIAEGRRENP